MALTVSANTFEVPSCGWFMSRSQRKKIHLVFFLQLVFLLSLTSPLVQGTNPYGDVSKMDSALESALQSAERVDESFEVIFQLNSPVTDRDLAYLSKVGATHLHEAKLIDGGLIEAPTDVLRKLSNWDRIEYLELNRELDFFYLPPDWGGDPTDPSIMMHETTHIVRATDAWHRAIIDVDGNVLFETDNAFTEWDGDGTAIVDLDTGVDAGHPDFDYLEPWTGEKVIYSAKWNGVWTETRNSDTSSGHGTHVGGTIAGNGDASAGRRAGVAKGGQMVALGTGDGASIFAAEQGLEWTYEHSVPSQNPYHIRVVSNSWGTDGDYDPNGAIATITDKLTFDNGVAVVI